MIDYEKLAEAMELLFKIRGKEAGHVSLRSTFSASYMCIYLITIGEKDVPGLYRGEDELIAKLKELTQPKPKYKVGDTVFTRHDREIYSIKIDEVLFESGEYWYLKYLKGGHYSEGEYEFDQYREDVVYPSREALIDAQIEYWKSLKSECEHESDGQFLYETWDGKYVFVAKHIEKDGIWYTNKPIGYECKKCGEFYR